MKAEQWNWNFFFNADTPGNVDEIILNVTGSFC